MNPLRPTGTSPFEYPERTTGSEVAAKVRRRANRWSSEKRAELFARGMHLINHGPIAGVIILERANPVSACAEPLQARPRQAANQMQIVARRVALVIFLTALGSGCSTNGRYADCLDHWPVQVHSVDSGSN